MQRIYLDHNATTRPSAAVRAAVAAALEASLGNPSSLHGPGREARERLERARALVARLIGAAPSEIVLCSGGTESDNLAVRGAASAARARDPRRRVVVSSPLEHPAVRGSLDRLRDDGFTVRLVEPDAEGRIDPSRLAPLLDEEVALCTLSLANHEIGLLYPVADYARLAHAAGALLHTDAVQAVGRVPVDVTALGADLLSLSAHKLHGPAGVGALWQRRGLDVAPLLAGGHQERERRPGTENVAGAVGLGVACDEAARDLEARGARVARLRDRLEVAALAIDGARRFGAAAPRVPGTTNLGFRGVPGELLLMALDLEGISVSTGAACSSGSVDPSPVIRALGVGRAEAATAVRFSLGDENTEEEIDRVAALLPSLVARIRAVGGWLDEAET